ncbi:hypothetical protein PPERSA_00714 [Pseudocohnilembus persalinus]|uniref:PLD phosphodiesterase domain-containing protein n=1 Tax=Pseudocohnilembus persalinus TaxID=266149 RepID=A0A0V0Q7U5_PSEPJ|nr:hypothetical protein PPERSA_00714 [Pseudocohnilembus persalinus]|eukprot:KRW98257.1 hypothetical protein PPERSA_00714 [Pseudocohnilembus persalinus]
MNFFDSKFFQESYQFNQEIKNSNIPEITYPSTTIRIKGDDFYKDIWREIDNAKDYCWIQTYAMDATFPAKLTIIKMIEALKRGVTCVLYVDDLQQYVDKNLIKEFQENGGIYKSLNPTWRHIYRNVPSQEFFRRHHEKLVVIDDFSVIGSQNFQDCYGSDKFGNGEFYDFNVMFKNQNLRNFRHQFLNVSDLYDLKLSNELSRDEAILKQDQNYPDSPFQTTKRLLTRTHQPFLRQIQVNILKMIDDAEKKITLIHPYYYPIPKFEKAIQRALKRGVKVELITSGKRDQPVYHYITNSILTKNLTKSGCEVYEIKEKLLHMKAYQIDDKHYSIGSFNNDRWSWKLNNEINIQVNNDPIEVQRLDQVINQVKSESKKISDQYSKVGPIRYAKILFWDTFLYLSEVIMSKNKYVSLEKYDYRKIYNDWDDQSNFNF